MRDAVLTGGNALPKDGPPDVTRFKAAVSGRSFLPKGRPFLGRKEFPTPIAPGHKLPAAA